MNTKIELPEKVWFTSQEIAHFLGVSKTTVITYIHSCGLTDIVRRKRRGDFSLTKQQANELVEYAYTYKAK